MNRRARSAALLGLLLTVPAALSAAAAADAPIPPAPPALRLDGSLAAPTRMAVELTLLPERETFSGAVAIDLDVRRPTDVLWLNATAITIHEAHLEIPGAEDPVTAEVLPGGDQFAGLRFAAPLAPGKATLHLAYEGQFEAVDTEGLFRQEHGGDWYVFSNMEPTSARRAFPCFDEPNYKVPWQLTLHVRREHTAVANMPVAEEREAEEGMKTVVFSTSPPLPSYLVALGVGPFDLVDGGRHGKNSTPVRMVVPKGRAAEAAWAASVTGEILARMEDYFGIPYPYPKLDNLVVPQTVGFGAMENAGLITYAERILLLHPERATESQRRGYAGVCAHENAHLWFGDLVSPAWWDDLWLNEGFATWMAGRFMAEWRPDWGGAVQQVERRARAMEADQLVSARRVRQPIAGEGDIHTAFDGISYSKGATLLAMFEEWLGPETMRKGIQRYLREHAHGNATSDDFLAALAAAGGAEVGRAFASFLDQAGVPVVSFDLACPEGGTPRLALAQKRYQPLGSPGAAAQTWQVPVRVRYVAGGKAGTARTLLSAAAGELPLEGAAGCPEVVVGNAGGSGYYLAALAAPAGEDDLLAPLLADPEAHLDLPERISLLRDAMALSASGDLALADFLSALPAFARSEERQLVEATVDLVEEVEELVPEALAPRYAAMVEELFGERARALGFHRRAGEDADTRLLRPDLLRVAALAGEDRTLRAEALRLARLWLGDRAAASPELVGLVLRLAARTGGPDLFDAYLAAARAATESRERRDLLTALGSFPEPALRERALGLVLGGGFDIREAGRLLQVVGREPDGREQLWRWLTAHYGELAKALPAQILAFLPELADGFCSEADRARVAAFFADKVRQHPGADRVLAQTLEQIQLCAAYRQAQAPSVAQFLERRGPAVEAPAAPLLQR